MLRAGGTALLEIPFDPTRRESESQPPGGLRQRVALRVRAARRRARILRRGRMCSPIARAATADDCSSAAPTHWSRSEVRRCRPRQSHRVRERSRGHPRLVGQARAPARDRGLLASQCSVRPGERLELHVSTRPAGALPDRRLPARLVRRARGASHGRRPPRRGRSPGGRARLPELDPRPAGRRRRLACHRCRSRSARTGRAGVYIARLIADHAASRRGATRWCPFVVRAAARARSRRSSSSSP